MVSNNGISLIKWHVDKIHAVNKTRYFVGNATKIALKACLKKENSVKLSKNIVECEK